MLVCTRRIVKRFVDLTADETSGLWLTAKEVGGKFERYHEVSALTFGIRVIAIYYFIILQLISSLDLILKHFCHSYLLH